MFFVKICAFRVLILRLSGYCSPVIILSPASNYAPNCTRLEIHFATLQSNSLTFQKVKTKT